MSTNVHHGPHGFCIGAVVLGFFLAASSTPSAHYARDRHGIGGPMRRLKPNTP